jgi:hypothetical protein
MGHQVLGTAPATTSWREAASIGRGTTTHVRDFLDFTIDGVPLRQLATGRKDAPHGVQEMTPLSELLGWPELAVAALRRLLLMAEPDFPGGRTSLLVCPIDADLDCRALSALVTSDAQTVEWRDLGWEVTYEPYDPARDGFDPPMTLVFDRAAYTATLEELLQHFEPLAAAQSGTLGRTPLRPARTRRWFSLRRPRRP